ncbi:MAG: tetratricopeptide repeat protein [Neisseriaceae bacterium]|nr:tetratricopeptide repeat protein [Neisseriaceae bacterium]
MTGIEEQEDFDVFKTWWMSWGRWLALSLVLVSGVYLAWSAKEVYLDAKERKASVLFLSVEDAANKVAFEEAKKSVMQLKTEYPKSAYTTRASFLLVDMAVQTKQTPEIIKENLQWIIDNSKEELAVAAANLRLAHVLLDAKEYDLALSKLNGLVPVAFTALYADTKGDILYAKGDKKGAQQAFDEALASLDEKNSLRTLLEMKRDALVLELKP